MNVARPTLQETHTSGDLLAEIAARAPLVGANSGAWPGLTFYHYVQPMSPCWAEVRSLSLCVIAQGRKRVVTEDGVHHYDPFNYLVLNGKRQFTAEILEATPAEPFLSLVLQVDPALVRRVSADALDRRTTTFVRPRAEATERDFVTPLDRTLMAATLRFLRATGDDDDRRVLAPIYLAEMVYRVLQAEQYSRLLEIAASEADRNPVSDVISFVQENMAQPLTVSELAERVSLSQSAFTHLFREVTGKSPYQFVKEMRLNRARELLVRGDLKVTQVSRAVGYRSASHFINEFRDRFGTTPRAYCDLQVLREKLAGR